MEALSASAQYLAVTSASAKFTNAMDNGVAYRFTCNTDCWVTVAATGGAAIASTANNHLCLAGQVLILSVPASDVSTKANGFIHVIRNAADGKATLSPIG